MDEVMDKVTPKHEHDCPSCKFLGRHETQGAEFDLYYCKQDWLGPTLVYRHSSFPPAYGSIPPNILQHMIEQDPDMPKDHPGLVAYDLAKKEGLINEPATV